MYRPLFMGIVLGAAALAACATPAADPTATATATAPTPTTTATATPHSRLDLGDAGVYGEILSVIPDTPEARASVQINNYALARDLFGLSLNGPDGQPRTLDEYIMAYAQSGPSFSMGGEAPWISGLWPSADIDMPIHMERKRHLGFDARDVDQTALARRTEPRVLEVLGGRFDSDATRHAIEACGDCPQPDVIEHRGTPYYTWGEDFETSAERQNMPPIFDRYGRGSSLVVQDTYVFRAVYQEGAESLIAAQKGAVRTLADVEDFRLLAAAMNGLNVYSAFFSDSTQSASPQQVPELVPSGGDPRLTERRQTVIAQGPVLRPYDAMGTAHGVDGQGPYFAIVLVHAEAEAAEENVGPLRERIDRTGFVMDEDLTWAEVVDEAEVWADERLLIARLRGERAGRLQLTLFDLEVLIVHE